MRKLSLLVTICIFLVSCKKECEDFIDVKKNNLELEFVRFEDQLFKVKNGETINEFVLQNKRLARYFFNSPYVNIEKDSAFTNHIQKLISHPSLDTVYQDAKKVYGDFSLVKNELENAYKHVKHYYPDFFLPKLGTIVSGFGNDMLVTDSLVVVSIDNFLGDACKYRPDVPNYLFKRMQKEYLVPTIILATSNKFNKTNMLDQTLLANMIWHGKALYFTKAMMPCLHDSLIIGYSGEELAGANSNEGIIWSHFIERDLLFTTSHTSEKYVSERPYTAEIGSKCPGRIGRWLGWLIVSRYVDETGVSLQDLMKETDANKILTLSKYKPKK